MQPIGYNKVIMEEPLEKKLLLKLSEKKNTNTKETILEIAQQYIDDFGFVPIPVYTGKKKITNKGTGQVKIEKNKSPVGKEWQKITIDTALDRIVDSYCNPQKRTKSNLGILTGRPSNIFVIDVDIKDNGMEGWQKLIDGKVITTMTAITTSGGFHYIFRYEDRLDIFASTKRAIIFDGIKYGIDFQTNGAQIIIYPSCYDGKQYQLDFEQRIEEMPEWLFEKLKTHYSGNVSKAIPISKRLGKPKIILKSNTKFKFEYEKENIQNLLKIIMSEQCDNYDEWLHIGMSIHSLNRDWLDLWIEYSNQSAKYVEGDCQYKWSTFDNRESFSIGTLRHFAKKSNLDEYKKWKVNQPELKKIIYKCLNGTTQRCAELLYFLYHNKFRFATKKDTTWYRFKNHKWELTESGLELRAKIGTKMYILFETEEKDLKVQVKIIEKNINLRKAELGNNHKKIEADEAIEKNNHQLKNLLTWIKCYQDFMLKLQDLTFKEKVMKEAQSYFLERGFEEKLDENPLLLCFNNGVYELKTGIFRNGQPNDYISLSTEMDYQVFPEADPKICEIFQFLSQVFTDEDLREYVLKVISSFLEGLNPEERFYIWTGGGGNGKSKLLALIKFAFGKYAKNLPAAVILESSSSSGESASPYMAAAKGLRLLDSLEPDEGKKFNVGKIKETTGNDRISCRKLYRDPFEYKPQFKLVFCCNKLPDIASNDDGTWRRICVIPFLSKFVENPDPNNSNQFPRDKYLEVKLQTWKEAFMFILLEYYKLYKIEGVKEPCSVLKATLKYRKNNEDADIDQWIELSLISNNDADVNGNFCFVQMKEIFQQFKVSDLYNRKIKKTDLQSLIERKFNINCKKRHKVSRCEYNGCFIGLTWNNKKDAEEEKNKKVCLI